MKKLQIIDLKYLKPIEEVDKYLKEHREYLTKQGYEKKLLLVSGRKDPLTGGMIIGSFDSIWDAKEFMKNDPFIINKVAEAKITEFVPVKCDEGLTEVLGAPPKLEVVK